MPTTDAADTSADASTLKAKDGYTQDDITLVQGIDHVRLRPAMYVGDVYERGLHHLVYEVVDNSVDEALAGFCSEIEVVIHEDDSISVTDNGRGIPVGLHKDANKPAVEVCLTEVGAGGKFEKGSYQVSGGLHGVGVSCVNALSEWLEAEVFREGNAHVIRFARGVTTEPLRVVGPSKQTGTRISFKPDPEIFTRISEFKFQTLSKRLRELAYLNKGLKIVIRDERGDGKSETYHFPQGIIDFVKELASGENPLLKEPIYLSGVQESDESGGAVQVEVAVQYNDTYNETVLSYANNIATIEGGTHLSGLRSALTTTLNTWYKDNQAKLWKNAKEDDRPTGDNYREGLVVVLSVKVPSPQFEGQTKTKLGNSDLAGIVQQVVGNYLRAWVEQHPAETKQIVLKAIQARKAQLAAKKAKELVRKAKDTLRGGEIAKLKDCESGDASECELYLVEGDSAGGTAVEGRDPTTQAILPLRGKILNVWKATHERMLSHSEIATIIQAVGTGILDEFDLESLKYHKIIIMCDADVDGSHIRTLLLTFFFRQMPELIQSGKVYVAQPPLFKIKRGKSEEYVLTFEEFERRMQRIGLEDAGLSLFDETGSERASYDGDALEALIKVARDLGRLGDEVEKRGTPFRTFLDTRDTTNQLPHARLYYPGEGRSEFAFDEAELEAAIEAAPPTAEGQPKVWNHSDPLTEREGATLEVTRFPNKRRIEELIQALRDHGLTLDDHFTRTVDPVTGEQPEPIGSVQRGKDRVELFGLADLPSAVLNLGERGIRVQRYKGLGEMDSDELWETTMDPSRRQLLKVSMDDMAEANRIFQILMGSKVEPRRDYIEDHAKDVTDLDV